MLNFIVNSDADDVAQLFVDYSGLTTRNPRDNVRNDRVMAFSVEPVTVNAPGDSTIFDADYETTDTFALTIGPIDEVPTGGTFSLDVGGTSTSLTSLSPSITAAALQTPLSAAFVTEGKSPCTVTLINEGVWQIDATTVGAIATGLLTGIATQLIPASELSVTEVSLGGVSTKYQLILSIRQAAIATATPSTALTAAGVTSTVTQASTASANKIATISMNAYGGTFSVSATVQGVTETCGVAQPTMSAAEFAEVLAGHSLIEFQNTDVTADNISVTKDGSSFIVEFTGTLGSNTLVRAVNDATVASPSVLTTSAAHGFVSGQSVTITNSTGTTPSLNGTYTITVLTSTTFSIPLNVTVASGESATVINTSQPSLAATNINLLAPLGRSGTINFNTINLYKLSLAQDTDSWTLPMQIERTRASGEVRQIFLGEVTLKKEIINTATMTAAPYGSVFFTDTVTGTVYQLTVTNGVLTLI